VTNANEFWISTNATGNLLSSGAPGTLDSPLDGSTQLKFDDNMNRLPAYSTIHIMAGTYMTHGSDATDGFTVKSGTKMLGSGIDVTILKLAPGTPDNTTMIQSVPLTGSTSTNIEISDLTCDCNYTSGSYTYHGIMLYGTDHAIRRVKLNHLVKMRSSNSESWGIFI